LCILVCHLPVSCISNVVCISGMCIFVCHLHVSCISNVVGISGSDQDYVSECSDMYTRGLLFQ
jgi:hypothetical protein